MARRELSGIIGQPHGRLLSRRMKAAHPFEALFYRLDSRNRNAHIQVLGDDERGLRMALHEIRHFGTDDKHPFVA